MSDRQLLLILCHTFSDLSVVHAAVEKFQFYVWHELVFAVRGIVSKAVTPNAPVVCVTIYCLLFKFFVLMLNMT